MLLIAGAAAVSTVRVARSPFLFSPVRLPGHRVAAAVLAAATVLTSACTRTRLRAYPRARAPTHPHAFTKQGKIDPFFYLSVLSQAHRRSARCEPRRRS
jgi:hypothetical protein